MGIQQTRQAADAAAQAAMVCSTTFCLHGAMYLKWSQTPPLAEGKISAEPSKWQHHVPEILNEYIDILFGEHVCGPAALCLAGSCARWHMPFWKQSADCKTTWTETFDRAPLPDADVVSLYSDVDVHSGILTGLHFIHCPKNSSHKF